MCVSGHSTKLSAGWREFRIGRRNGTRSFVPVQATMRQIRSGGYRRKLGKMLNEDLVKEAKDAFE